MEKQLNIIKKNGTYQENIVEEVKRVCPADYEEASNRISELKGE